MMLEDQIAWNRRKSYLLLFIVPVILLALIFVSGSIFVPRASPFLILAAGSGISVLYVLFSYFKSDEMILSVVGAEPADREKHDQLYDLMEGLTISSGMEMPELYVQDKPGINAFATGRKPEDGKVCVTAGALEKLDQDELEGVLAHELAHIQNYDILFMTVAVALIGVISILSELLLHSMYFGGDDNSPPWLVVAGFALAILAPISARMVQLAMSRKREYLADASGAQMTRYPEGLASALEKIQNENSSMKVNKAVSHLYFSNPLGNKKNFFSTHPPLEQRIERLRNM
ncbi:M48 family metallopeptidase [Candidatus Nanohalovita haloferacivicina]|uniref:M48 family metallopeptidase n=1 Tax=Candidatus Nanohalovita haloferacivicina TaxID=2978046 RepID=UPI00325FD538|nr:Heat shock protein HtpX [Candidatus Nanohalobia archaeon BNXNv]